MIEPGVYLLIREHVVIYVGQTLDIKHRLIGHKNKHFDRYHFFKCPIDKLNWFEEELINRFRPVWNKVTTAKVSPHNRIIRIKQEIRRLEQIIRFEERKQQNKKQQ